MRACVTKTRATVYVCVLMPEECVCERKDKHACRKKLAAQQGKTNVHFAEFICKGMKKKWEYTCSMRGFTVEQLRGGSQ